MGKHFLWDPVEDNIVKEIDDAGNSIADYTTEPYLYGDLISQHRDGQSSFYHYDGQGSTTSLTDSVGNVTDTYEYTAFGEVSVRIGSTVNPFLYVGQLGYYCHLGGDTLVRERWQRSSGRWISSDPMIGVLPDTALGKSSFQPFRSHGDTTNAYIYALNSPVRNVDPSGLQVKPPSDQLCIGWYDRFPPPKTRPKPKPISDTAKRNLRLCNCGPVETTVAQLQQDPAMAFVTCFNNGFQFQENIWNPARRRDWAVMVRCGYDECYRQHEEHHIAQFEERCPNACRNVVSGQFTSPPRDPIFLIGFEEACESLFECSAHLTDISCHINMFWRRREMGDRNLCMATGRNLVVNSLAIMEGYKCQIPPALQQRINDVLYG